MLLRVARRLIRATGHSLKGLVAAVRFEEAFRIELVILAAAVPLALWLGPTALDRVLLIGSVLLLMIVELLNSAVEAVVDRVGTEYHELSGRAKDLASAAVFVAVALVALVWLGLLVPVLF